MIIYMKIQENYIGLSGLKYIFDYEDSDDFSHLPYEKVKQCYGVCFTGNNTIVIVYNKNKDTWGLVGGTIESGETYEQTLKREILEEANMKVVAFKPIGYQKVTDARDNSYVYQLRFMCNVEPVGPFISDPAGSVTEIREINPLEYKKYFNWGQIGQRIIDRAQALKLIEK